MKKITTRKLSLNRETIRNLDLAKVGGAAKPTQNIICDTINITLSNDGSCVLDLRPGPRMRWRRHGHGLIRGRYSSR